MSPLMKPFLNLVCICLMTVVSVNLYAEANKTADQKYPDIIGVDVRQTGSTYSFAVTLSSPYDTPERYADAFRVLDAQGNELGLRVLWHDHASEQPFTRSLTGVSIPSGTTVVFIEARDKTYGWSGSLQEASLP